MWRLLVAMVNQILQMAGFLVRAAKQNWGIDGAPVNHFFRQSIFTSLLDGSPWCSVKIVLSTILHILQYLAASPVDVL